MGTHRGGYGFRNINPYHSEEAKAIFVMLGHLSEDAKQCTTSKFEIWELYLPCTSR
jgi:hypothetical protein